VLSLKVEEIRDLIMRELTEGEKGIRCGIIGEIGCSWPLEGQFLNFLHESFWL